MSFTLTFCDVSGPTEDREGATHVILRNRGRVVATLAHATHPRFGVRGYTLEPHPKDPAVRAPRGYRPEELSDGILPAALQAKMWVDPAEGQPADITRPASRWGTLDDLCATLEPLLKD